MIHGVQLVREEESSLGSPRMMEEAMEAPKDNGEKQEPGLQVQRRRKLGGQLGRHASDP